MAKGSQILKPILKPYWITCNKYFFLSQTKDVNQTQKNVSKQMLAFPWPLQSSWSAFTNCALLFLSIFTYALIAIREFGECGSCSQLHSIDRFINFVLCSWQKVHLFSVISGIPFACLAVYSKSHYFSSFFRLLDHNYSRRCFCWLFLLVVSRLFYWPKET